MATTARNGLLRMLTCGSVDDGKSTLIGRLMHDSRLLYEDQLAALHKASGSSAAVGASLALVADGLKAEREQGITIDVAHLYFSTARRSFIIADTPGHEQYTRNMVTGASNCDLAVILVDAARGPTLQTRRHAKIVSLLGIAETVIAVNKMDLVGFDEARFSEVADEVAEIAAAVGVASFVCIPMSALNGDGVVEAGPNMAWYSGPCLLDHLEQVDTGAAAARHAQGRLRLPVQLVVRPDHRFRGFAGTVAEGTLRVGDAVTAEPSGLSSTVTRITTFDGDLTEATAGRAVTVTLSDEIDLSRGDMLVDCAHRARRGREICADVVWMSQTEGVVGRQYLLQQGGQLVNCRIVEVVERIDIGTLEGVRASTLALNDIARVKLLTDTALVHDVYEQNRSTGSFILIDPAGNATAAAGMITEAGPSDGWHAAPDANIERQRSSVAGSERAALLGHDSMTVWFTGLPGSGKSTLAHAVEAALIDSGVLAFVLDGDNLRFGLNRDLGFSPEDRTENIRRAGEASALMAAAGVVVLAAFVSPYRSDRDQVRSLHPEGGFLEVFVDAPLAVCEQRDPKGLYARARAGEIADMTGLSAPYEQPEGADLRIPTAAMTVAEATESILREIRRRIIPGATSV